MKKILVAIVLIIIGFQFFLKNSPALEQEIPLHNESVHNGELILVNKETKLQQDPTNLAVIPSNLASNVVVDSEYLLEKKVIEPLQKMFEQAAKDGIHHFKINSAYRSGNLQQQLYEENGASYALPTGYSEHQSGLSLDIGSTQGTMEKTLEGEWLAKNAADYGFILRYPKNKVDVTGIAFEPWHFRYVGLPHSVMMEKKNFALEEYLLFLKEKRHYKKQIKGITYYVQYVENMEVAHIPNTDQVNISGDNHTGYIITSVIN